MDQLYPAATPRLAEAYPRKRLLMVGSQVCDLMRKNRIKYCVFRTPDNPALPVEASVVLYAVGRMTKHTSPWRTHDGKRFC